MACEAVGREVVSEGRVPRPKLALPRSSAVCVTVAGKSEPMNVLDVKGATRGEIARCVAVATIDISRENGLTVLVSVAGTVMVCDCNEKPEKTESEDDTELKTRRERTGGKERARSQLAGGHCAHTLH